MIHNAVSPLFFEPFDADAEAFLEISNLKGKRFVLLPGGLHYRKNAELVLRAWPILRDKNPDLTLVVAGYNHLDYVRAAKSLGPPVLLTGFVEDQQLRALYQGAQVVWFPSQYEGFGIPVLEAMACGTPVVASNNTAIPEISGDAALLVHPRSVDQNVQAVEAVLNDGQLQANLRMQGKKRVEAFTWPASAAQLHRIYSELV